MTDRLLVVLGIAPAAIAGWFAHAALRSSPLAAAMRSSPARVVPRSAFIGQPTPLVNHCDTATLAQIRALLRNHANNDSPSSSTKTEPEPKSAASVAEEGEKLTAIEHAISDGVWSAEDRELLRATLRTGSPELRDAALSKVVLAINRGQLKEQVPVF